MRVQLECMYCGHKWEEEVYNKSSIEEKKCIRGSCRDSNLIVRDISTSKIDGYKGCKPFPPKKKDTWFMGVDYGQEHPPQFIAIPGLVTVDENMRII